MIVVTLKGGLGNQMFQYAAARALALKHGSALLIDQSFLKADPAGQWTARAYQLNVFPALSALKEYTMLDRMANKISPAAVFEESSLAYDAAFEKLGKHVRLEGYFQTEKYFLNYADQIRADFSFPSPANEKNAQMMHEIAEAVCPVSIHIRRGDMVTLKSASEHHGTMSTAYYAGAMDWVNERTSGATYFIFSDDIAWARENVRPNGIARYIDWNADNALEDMRLMSLCHHHIVANSSFSWWAAWLNRRIDKLVVAPRRWFNDSSLDTSDLIPTNWVRL